MALLERERKSIMDITLNVQADELLKAIKTLKPDKVINITLEPHDDRGGYIILGDWSAQREVKLWAPMKGKGGTIELHDVKTFMQLLAAYHKETLTLSYNHAHLQGKSYNSHFTWKLVNEGERREPKGIGKITKQAIIDPITLSNILPNADGMLIIIATSLGTRTDWIGWDANREGTKSNISKTTTTYNPTASAYDQNVTAVIQGEYLTPLKKALIGMTGDVIFYFAAEQYGNVTYNGTDLNFEWKSHQLEGELYRDKCELYNLKDVDRAVTLYLREVKQLYQQTKGQTEIRITGGDTLRTDATATATGYSRALTIRNERRPIDITLTPAELNAIAKQRGTLVTLKQEEHYLYTSTTDDNYRRNNAPTLRILMERNPKRLAQPATPAAIVTAGDVITLIEATGKRAPAAAPIRATTPPATPAAIITAGNVITLIEAVGKRAPAAAPAPIRGTRPPATPAPATVWETAAALDKYPTLNAEEIARITGQPIAHILAAQTLRELGIKPPAPEPAPAAAPIRATTPPTASSVTIPRSDSELAATLSSLEGVIVTYSKLCIWVGGDTYPHRHTLKSLGYRWSPKKKLWYQSREAVRAED